MDSYAHFNGKFAKKEEISIHLSDRSIFFGDGVYDAAIGKNGEVLWEKEHIKRILENAKAVGITHTLSESSLSRLLHDTVKRSGINEYFIYFSITRRSEHRVHSAGSANGSNLLITVDEFCLERDDAPLKLITMDDLRYSFCNLKTINLLPAVLALTEAEKCGCDEVAFIRDGKVTECAKSNISILFQGRLITHPNSRYILPGITRAHIIMAARDLGIPVDERPFSPAELMRADEVIVSSSSKLCKRVGSINGVSVGGRDIQNYDKIRNILLQQYDKLYN